MTEIHVGPVADFDSLGQRWRDLERRSRPSFFQSWTWTGCLAEERFPDPVLVEAIEAGRTVALALFNRRPAGLWPATLHLHESGDAELDCPYIEQNGVLAEAGRETELTTLCLRAVARRHRLVLSGIKAGLTEAVAAATGLMVAVRRQPSPFADLADSRRTGRDVLAGCSANTRQQVRRSNRFFARSGPITVTEPGSVAAALALLDRMADLHQAAWRARDKPGSFARPFFRRFHAALIHRGHPRGEVRLLRVANPLADIGILYNFTFGGRMLAYQSGLAYQPGIAQARPGLTCHHAAMQLALNSGFNAYDFLAGDHRYKQSLATGAYAQSWIEAGPLWSPPLWLQCLRSRRIPAARRADRDARGIAQRANDSAARETNDVQAARLLESGQPSGPLV